MALLKSFPSPSSSFTNVRLSTRVTASPRRSSTSYARREEHRRISSVSAVRVLDRVDVRAARAEIWDWVVVERVARDVGAVEGGDLGVALVEGVGWWGRAGRVEFR